MAPDPSFDEEIRELCTLLAKLEGIEPVAARAGKPAENTYNGHVSMRVEGPEAVHRLLETLGRKFSVVFHVDDQKCEMGFRVEVSTAGDALRYNLRFWGCPEWGMERIRTVLTERVAGDRDRQALPSLEPPWREDAA